MQSGTGQPVSGTLNQSKRPAGGSIYCPKSESYLIHPMVSLIDIPINGPALGLNAHPAENPGRVEARVKPRWGFTIGTSNRRAVPSAVPQSVRPSVE